ncbi:MAG TPA: hypothetical protein GX394_07400 [Clostridiales bacterium]|jgi:hypothetical protein|nr:hypothetical protein [Clostridiales bacterium]
MTSIALSRSLNRLKQPLENLGYEVFIEDEIVKPVDIFIYSNSENLHSLQSTMQVLNSTFSSNIIDPSEYRGTLLIDGSNKSVEELQYIIRNRAYSPIL